MNQKPYFGTERMPRERRWRASGPEDKSTAWVLAMVSASALAMGVWASMAEVSTSCAWRRLLGIPCPTCGTTRMLHAVAHGRLLEAFQLNPLVFAAGAALLLSGVAAPIWVRAGLPVPNLRVPLAGRARWAMLAIFLANWSYVAWREIR